MYISTILTTGCVANNTENDRAIDDTSSTTSTADSAIEYGDSELLNSAMWFNLDASATIDRGTLTSTTLTLSTFAEPTEEPLCEETITAMSLDPDTPPYETIDTWWGVEWDLSTINCSTALRLPAKIILGMGELHQDLAPYLYDAGVTDTDGGAFLSFGEPDSDQELRVYAYGYLSYTGDSETTDDGADVDTADINLRLDGTWDLHGLFLFPLKSIEEEDGD
tara:strand:- start:727 stop:1392 length:666 start_codon:yes stop_codon:yes gene_type:complete